MKNAKHTRRLIAAMTSMALLAGCSSAPAKDSQAVSSGTASTADATYTIGLAQLVDHPSLNTIRDAMLDEFDQEGYKKDENLIIDYQNAAGKTSSLDTIMNGYEAEGVDAIIAIATPTAMSAQNYADEIPVIFSAVSDPVGAGLVASIEEPGGNITGTSDEVQVEQIIDLMLQLSPDVKTVGVLYNAGEANSVSNIERFKAYADTKGLTVVEKTGTDSTTMQQAAAELADTCDAMFSPNDNTVATAMASLGKIAEDAGVPYYVGADSMVQTGGFATVGIDYEQLGRETAKMTIEVLNGVSPAAMPVKVFKDDLNVYVNENYLQTLEASSKTPVSLPDDLASQDNLIKVTEEE